jgi:hypothetical protein
MQTYLESAARSFPRPTMAKPVASLHTDIEFGLYKIPIQIRHSLFSEICGQLPQRPQRR